MQSTDVGTSNVDGLRELFLQPVTSRNPFEETVAQLARAIRLGALAVGDKFPPERELGRMLHVSRTTVREAIRGLEQAGYITTRRGRFGGSFVVRDEVELSARDRARVLGPQLIEVLDFRAAIEPGAAALAARNAGIGQIERMRTLVAEMEHASRTDFVRANCRLHILFAQAADCRPLLNAVTTAELQIMDALLAVPRLEQSVKHSHAQHRAIIDAIAAGYSAAARDALEEHLAGADVILRELVASKRSGA
jgi:GntR family transcriptional regulator, L-lactate dehydrogenase operon regulator